MVLKEQPYQAAWKIKYKQIIVKFNRINVKVFWTNVMKCYICAINLINRTNMIHGKYEGFSISNSLNLVDKVEIEIISYFIEHGYKIGDSIPNEIQLASELGVARSVLRDAFWGLSNVYEGR